MERLRKLLRRFEVDSVSLGLLSAAFDGLRCGIGGCGGRPGERGDLDPGGGPRPVSCMARRTAGQSSMSLAETLPIMTRVSSGMRT